MPDWREKLGESVTVDVEYYDSIQKALLSSYPTASTIAGLVANGVSIPVPEFLTHVLFHRIRANPAIYTGYAAIRHRIAESFGMLGEMVALENGRLRLAQGIQNPPTYLAETIGESIALSVINRVHGLSEADWKPIPTRPGRKGRKTLDYQYGSDGERMVQLEAKGTVAAAQPAGGKVYSAKAADIERKKLALPRRRNELRYGAIVEIPREETRLRCLLLDPVPEEFERAPRDLRAIARVEFLRWIVWLVSPRSALATALANRVLALTSMRDPFELSGVPLSQADGTSMELKYSYMGNQRHATFFDSRSLVSDGPAGGVVVRSNPNEVLFIGFRAELLQMSIAQEFDSILAYAADVGSVKKKIICAVPTGEFDRDGWDSSRLPGFNQSGAYARFELEGMLHYSKEGLVFGRLTLPA